jgi:N-methylhydantoinase A
MELHLQQAETSFEQLAQQIKMDVVNAAKGVIDVANVNIDRALRRVSIARGHDPRDFTLVAFGGAGPLHACEVAERLDMPRVLIPRYPGVLCALGLLVANVKVDHSLPVLVRANRDLIASLRAMQADILAMGRDDLRREGIADDDMAFEVFLDMRYEGQAHELMVPFSANVIDDFHEAHRITYGHSLEGRRVEIVNMRLQATGRITRPELHKETSHSHSSDIAYLGEKKSPLGGVMALYDRELLQTDAHFNGEALVFQLDSTVYVAQGWSAQVDGYRNLILERL